MHLNLTNLVEIKISLFLIFQLLSKSKLELKHFQCKLINAKRLMKEDKSLNN